MIRSRMMRSRMMRSRVIRSRAVRRYRVRRSIMKVMSGILGNSKKSPIFRDLHLAGSTYKRIFFLHSNVNIYYKNYS